MMSSHSEQIHDRIALITGTSSGFGLLTAIQLAGQGYKVIATMRDLSRKGELEREADQAGLLQQLHFLTMDVTDHTSIEEVINSVQDTFGRIDVLVNNAGFATGGFIEEITMEEWRRQMETNFFGVVAVTRAVLPIMRKQRSGMIINMGSISGLSGFPGYAPYAASKFAIEGFSESLRHEMSPYGIRVVLIEPGSFRTPIWGKGMEQIRLNEDSPYRERLAAVLRYSKHTAETAPDPQQVAALIGRITKMRAPRLRYPIGKGTRTLIIGKTLLPWKWLERIIAKELR